MLMIHTGMLGIVVVTGNCENDVKSAASVLNEIGVGGLNIEVVTDNEPYLVDLMAKGLSKSNARACHWRNISEYRPQAKGVERAVGIAKEGIYTNWLAFEQHCQCRIALESPPLGYSDMFIEHSMYFAIRGVGLHLNVCGTHGEVKSRLLFRLESLDFQNLLF